MSVLPQPEHGFRPDVKMEAFIPVHLKCDGAEETVPVGIALQLCEIMIVEKLPRLGRLLLVPLF